MNREAVVIIGAGPAGLSAGYELARRGIRPLVLEKADKVGGIARTETYRGYRFDIGGHRFFTKAPEVQQVWQQMLGEDLLRVRRLSRISYRNRFFSYPLEPFNALSNLGIVESLLVLWSYAKTRLCPCPQEETFEQWVVNRFGRRLYETFFQTYTEKLWGIPCHTIQADWAAQRIAGMSLRAAVSNAIFGTNHTKTLIKEFDYPVLGPGMMWQRFQEAIEGQGGEVRLNTEVVGLKRQGNRIRWVVTRRDGETEAVEISAEHLISSMPITELVARLDPPPPADVLQAAGRLKHRAFILVGLILDRPDLFPDNWIYVHSPEVKVGRIQNFKNWSAAMVPDPHKTSLGMEYFCSEGDDTWAMEDGDLLALATREVARLGLAAMGEVEDGYVIRQPKAYPVYDREYRQHLGVIRGLLATIDNLQTVGRNGMHRYNNQDHSMLTAMLAVRNLLGEAHDLWSVNADESYHEEIPATRPLPATPIGIPRRLPLGEQAAGFAGDRFPEELTDTPYSSSP